MVVCMYMCLHVTEEIKLISFHQIRNKDINEGTSVTYKVYEKYFWKY